MIQKSKKYTTMKATLLLFISATWSGLAFTAPTPATAQKKLFTPKAIKRVTCCVSRFESARQKKKNAESYRFSL